MKERNEERWKKEIPHYLKCKRLNISTSSQPSPQGEGVMAHNMFSRIKICLKISVSVSVE